MALSGSMGHSHRPQHGLKWLATQATHINMPHAKAAKIWEHHFSKRHAHVHPHGSQASSQPGAAACQQGLWWHHGPLWPFVEV